jgi:hypothetical protein
MNMTKKIVLAALAVFAVAGAACAQITISGGVAVSSAKNEGYSGEAGIGGNVYLDYLLPLSVPVSLGLELGIDTAKFNEDRAMAIPLLLRVAYHFDISSKLDLYLVGKIGYAFGAVSSEDPLDASGGVGFGFDAGAAFYFTPHVGVFVEAGFDRYNGKVSYDGYYERKGYFNRFFTAGLSVKF